MKRVLTAIALCMLLAGIVPASAQDVGDHPLLDLLAYVPDNETYREFLSYGDYALWNQSWGFTRISSLSELELRSDLGDRTVPATLFVMTEQTGAPQALGIQYLMSQDLRGFFGIDLFNTDRYLEAGNPPNTLTVLETSATTAAVASALQASGYAESTLGDMVLFSQRDDFGTDVASDQPMIARLGILNRVALADNAVVIARATSIVEGAAAAAAGQTPSLADNAFFAAGALAVSDPEIAGEGALVGAIFMGQDEPLDYARMLGANATPEQVAALEASLDVGMLLPAYELAVFGTRRRAADSQLLLALVFPDGVDAQAATNTLMMRMKRYDSLLRRQPLLDLWAERGVAVEWGRGVEVNGQPVALVSLSVRTPTLEETSNGTRDTFIFSWRTMVYSYDLGFMAQE